MRALQPALATAVVGNCTLATELDRLAGVYECGAFEAAVFYAARVLEALAAEALRKVRLSPASVVLSNLDLLQQFDLVSPATRAWAHALRRLGNDVRHLLRPIGRVDADLAMIFVERWLEWFYRDFAYGERLPALTLEGGPLFESGQNPLQQFIYRCSLPGADASDLAEQLCANKDQLLRLSPAPAAVISERLIERHMHDAAQKLVDMSRKYFPDDARLCQLQGLIWSRGNQAVKAIGILEPLNLRFASDPETAGILAGAYKRFSNGSDDPARWLRKAQGSYDRGWKSSHNASAYLGVNSATLLLWLGNDEASRTLAAEVRDLLLGRIEQLSAVIPDAIKRMNFWDRVTLAECELLLGEIEAARDNYLAAFADFPEERDSIQVAQLQANQILERTGASDRVSSFWQALA